MRSAASLQGDSVVLDFLVEGQDRRSRGIVETREGIIVAADLDSAGRGLQIQLDAPLLRGGVEYSTVIVRLRHQGEGYAPFLAHYPLDVIAYAFDSAASAVSIGAECERFSARLYLVTDSETGELIDLRCNFDVSMRDAIRSYFGNLSRTGFAASLGAFLLALAAAWDEEFEPISWFYLLLAFLALSALALVLVFVNRRLASITAVCILLHFTGCASGSLLSELDDRRSEWKGDEILRAAAAFESQHGRLPIDLAEMVPEYFDGMAGLRVGPLRMVREISYQLAEPRFAMVGFTTGYLCFASKAMNSVWAYEDWD